jgi:hypothetical protein
VAVGVDDEVSVWHHNSSREISELESSWDISGRTLTISDDGKLCAVGAYQRYGGTVFDALKGAMLLEKKRPKKSSESEAQSS